MITNVQVSFVTYVKSNFKAGGTRMGRPYPDQYLGRGVPSSELNFMTCCSEYLIATGGYPKNKKTELLSRSNTWTTQSDFPFGTEHF